MKMNQNILLAFFLALGLTLSILESFIPTILPGFKIGLSNIMVLVVLYKFNFKSILTYVLLRNTLYLLLFGQVLLFMYSFSGSLLSVLGMYLTNKFFKNHFSIFGISIIGANLHNLGQLFVAKIHLNVMISTFIPFFILLSLFSGILTAYIANRVIIKIDESSLQF